MQAPKGLQLARPDWPHNVVRRPAAAGQKRQAPAPSAVRVGASDLVLLALAVAWSGLNVAWPHLAGEPYFAVEGSMSFEVILWLQRGARWSGSTGADEQIASAIGATSVLWGAAAVCIFAMVSASFYLAISWASLPVWLRTKSAVFVAALFVALVQFTIKTHEYVAPLPLGEDSCFFLGHSAASFYGMMTAAALMVSQVYPASQTAVESEVEDLQRCGNCRRRAGH
ncbi:hypothetical protein FNF27_05171 [Cafeteria roenbergensis]|uniref:Uncharacterized protein n=1 Tax=Cafeteria roenbergensis TaxID=33653 RepID=A0A5A8E8A3_CAFRO|nr:hypothetical protein FNF27_05171 [Cafeteria roenbergensis]